MLITRQQRHRETDSYFVCLCIKNIIYMMSSFAGALPVITNLCFRTHGAGLAHFAFFCALCIAVFLCG